MKVSKLIKYLTQLKDKYGDLEVDILTESQFNSQELKEIVKYRALQVEQPLGDVAYTSGEDRIKLLPEGF